jgi:outer membrane protein insertion porin family
MKKLLFILAILFIGTGCYSSEPLSMDPGSLNLKNILKTIDRSATKSKALNKKKTQKENAGEIIKEIAITGNKLYSAELILNEITLKKGDAISPFRIRRTIKNLKDLGVFSEVTSSVKKVSGGKKITIHVVENPIVSKVLFAGRTIIPADILRETIYIKKDMPLNRRMLRRDILRINNIYHDKGYSQAKVYKTTTPKKSNDPLIFHISEGEISEIIITGNTRTKEYVILREMTTKPGMAWQDDRIKEDLRRVFNLNFFQDIQPEILPSEKKNAKILRLNIAERPTNATFTFGGGYSPTMGFSIFSDLFWDNLLGTAQVIMLKGQFGRANTYQLKYHNPWMWDERKSLTVRTWLTDGQIGSVNPLQQGNILFQNERRRGLDLSVGWPTSYELRTSHKVTYEDVKLLDVDKGYKVQSYTFGLSYDTRDVWFNPSIGEYHTFSIEKGFKLFGSSLDFTRYDLGIRKFFPTFEKQALAARLECGYVTSPQIDDQDIFRSQWYYVGGSTTVRGYDDMAPFSYGNKQIIANLEYRFLFNDMFQGVIFLDSGYASSGTINDLSKFKIGKGVGLRINIPGLGPLRLDYGIDDLGVGRIHFNLGHTF